ncbi:hypothetical protein ACWF76_03135 [Streptomyces globisporus]
MTQTSPTTRTALGLTFTPLARPLRLTELNTLLSRVRSRRVRT